MPGYSYTFINPATGRLNTRKGHAYDEAELREGLRLKGIEPVSLDELPQRPATGPQIEYLRSLGVRVPSGLLITEASSLIENAKGKLEPAGKRDREIADLLRVEINKYSSKSEIYKHVLNALQERPVAHLAAWYAYRVYRSSISGSRRKGGPMPDADCFRVIGEDMALDERALRSLLKAANETDYCAFRWFGQFVTPDGATLQGDSNRTYAYQFARNALIETGLLAQMKSGEAASKEQNGSWFSTSFGTTGVAVLIIILLSAWLI